MSSSWESKGRIEIKDGRVVLPSLLPAEPGLYKLQFDEKTLYIGEAADLQRRLGDYVKYYASTGIESELRINHALLENSRGAEVWVLVGTEFDTHSARCIRESMEIKKAKSDPTVTVLNGGSLEQRIAFHESETVRLRAKLADRQRTDGATND